MRAKSLESPETIRHYVGMRMIISRELLARIKAEALAAAPHECCGLLLGNKAGGAVHSIAPAANMAADSRRRFEIDPAVLLAAHKSARRGGPQIIGHYHSHPAGEARPSQTDAAMAAGEGEYWLIVDGSGEAAAWRATRGDHGLVHFHPVLIES